MIPNDINLQHRGQMLLYVQIAEAIIKKIDSGEWESGFMLPSINVFSEKYKVARATAEKAYNLLKQQGYISSIGGKGYFVESSQDRKPKILFIFNKISSFKKTIYYSFLETLGNKAIVDMQIHHYNPQILNSILDNNLGKYQYFVIMAHFQEGVAPEVYQEILKRVPPESLILIDKWVDGCGTEQGVYQDFKNDIYTALNDAKGLICKYKKIALLFQEHRNHPIEVIQGVTQFAEENMKTTAICTDSKNIELEKKTLYITLYDDDLATLLKKAKHNNYKLGKDFGILSFNESELKEVLDISVISTNFEQMGQAAANLILNRKIERIKNPFTLIRRKSL